MVEDLMLLNDFFRIHNIKPVLIFLNMFEVKKIIFVKIWVLIREEFPLLSNHKHSLSVMIYCPISNQRNYNTCILTGDGVVFW
jgi:hypothetical protein